jgi:hypothetical protein
VSHAAKVITVALPDLPQVLKAIIANQTDLERAKPLIVQSYRESQ